MSHFLLPPPLPLSQTVTISRTPPSKRYIICGRPLSENLQPAEQENSQVQPTYAGISNLFLSGHDGSSLQPALQGSSRLQSAHQGSSNLQPSYLGSLNLQSAYQVNTKSQKRQK
ncbi:hypothetical protein AVEN_131477-1 [Araneus ventricosus]|uniref:Uncharacterized protein n=1 Tax=Araneus ventricosus TaxID=182803 RepID=A0A4Y2JCR9_ARAVE|nr:hypothetical protein AVEN_131477-1 [Araneus ventricosus]